MDVSGIDVERPFVDEHEVMANGVSPLREFAPLCLFLVGQVFEDPSVDDVFVAGNRARQFGSDVGPLDQVVRFTKTIKDPHYPVTILLERFELRGKCRRSRPSVLLNITLLAAFLLLGHVNPFLIVRSVLHFWTSRQHRRAE
jgi:hypothetical protein